MLLPSALAAPQAPVANRPNIVLMLADDLGYGDLGCYGQRQIRTPNLDRLAAEGIRFTDCYAGSTVCAPSRCALLTGMHMGHARIRGNSRLPLADADVTLGEVLSAAGYRTAVIGKWGLGDDGTSGAPQRQGFQHSFGYLDQVHAHNYYPDYLWRDGQKIFLPNVVAHGVATKRVVYSPDLVTAEALEFLTANREKPFFLYLTFTLPHANNEAGKQHGMEVPDDGPYAGAPWPAPQKHHAAMITRLDGYVGQVLKRLASLGLDQHTLVLFTSDNGPHHEGGADPKFFNSSGGLRGYKRALYEGGIRVPAIVRWTGHVPRGVTSRQMWAFWDVLPTLAALTGAQAPKGLDGISVLPALMDPATRLKHAPLYWEFYEGAFAQAARMGKWKAVRPSTGAALELYDLEADRAESHDVAAENRDVALRLGDVLKRSHVDSPDWTIQPAPTDSHPPRTGAQ